MNQVVFTRKHQLAASLITVMSVILSILMWFLLVAPVIKSVETANKELEQTQSIISSLKSELTDLNKEAKLLESSLVTETPKIPNGITLEDFFQEIKGSQDNTNTTILAMKFDWKLVYPDAAGASIQLRKGIISLDVTAERAADLVRFIDQLEQGSRFVKVQDVLYRAEVANDGESFAFSSTVTLDMYYLSEYETGKMILQE